MQILVRPAKGEPSHEDHPAAPQPEDASEPLTATQASVRVAVRDLSCELVQDATGHWGTRHRSLSSVLGAVWVIDEHSWPQVFDYVVQVTLEMLNTGDISPETYTEKCQENIFVAACVAGRRVGLHGAWIVGAGTDTGFEGLKRYGPIRAMTEMLCLRRFYRHMSFFQFDRMRQTQGEREVPDDQINTHRLFSHNYATDGCLGADGELVSRYAALTFTGGDAGYTALDEIDVYAHDLYRHVTTADTDSMKALRFLHGTYLEDSSKRWQEALGRNKTGGYNAMWIAAYLTAESPAGDPLRIQALDHLTKLAEAAPKITGQLAVLLRGSYRAVRYRPEATAAFRSAVKSHAGVNKEAAYLWRTIKQGKTDIRQRAKRRPTDAVSRAVSR